MPEHLFTVQQIDRPDEIVATAVRLLDSPEWANLTAGLAVLTGRRVAELLSTAEFEKKTQWSVIFTGALKRRGEPVTLSFEIPTLTTADRVIRALDKLRFELPEATKLTPEDEIAHYKSKRKGIKLGVSNIEPIEEFQKAWRKGMEPKAPREKKARSSFRVWQDDKTRLDRILEPFQSAGTHQSDRFHAFLDWFESQQHHLSLPQAESTEAEPAPAEATPTDADSTKAIPMQTQAAPEPTQLGV